MNQIKKDNIVSEMKRLLNEIEGIAINNGWGGWAFVHKNKLEEELLEVVNQINLLNRCEGCKEKGELCNRCPWFVK